MKAYIIYDSMYGNTEKIAQAIGEGLTGEVNVVCIGEANLSELKTCDLLVFGSPVHGGRATPELDTFIKQLPANFLEGISVTAFDTRFEAEDQGAGLRLLMSVIRYAAPRIAKTLEKKGGILVVVEDDDVHGSPRSMRHARCVLAADCARRRAAR